MSASPLPANFDCCDKETFAASISTPLRPDGRREAWSGGAPKNIQLAKNIRTLTRVSVLEALVRDDGVT
jgi:hypothetical protein